MNQDEKYISKSSLPDFSLWDKLKQSRRAISFDLEITARCNNNCRHCYINLPQNAQEAKEKELSLEEIKKIVDEAVCLGGVWCLVTGGEPLLRRDFFDIYLYLKKKGLLVSVFTNATTVSKKHVDFFKKYPPRDIEVTVYGVTARTYERVTRIPGSFGAFMRGLNLLLENKIKVRFKTMALRSNVEELPEIASFCRERTKDYFRFDPFLHLRYDADPLRNAEIKAERLSSPEIAQIEEQDSERFGALEKNCSRLINPALCQAACDHLFHCGLGNGSFTLSYDGFFQLCSSLHHPDCVYDLKRGSLIEAWENFIPRVRGMRSDSEEFLKKCHVCLIINLCMWCPARAHLESGELDKPIDYFCEVAHARAQALSKKHKYG